MVKLVLCRTAEGHCILDGLICWQQCAIIINISTPNLFLCISVFFTTSQLPPCIGLRALDRKQLVGLFLIAIYKSGHTSHCGQAAVTLMARAEMVCLVAFITKAASVTNT